MIQEETVAGDMPLSQFFLKETKTSCLFCPGSSIVQGFVQGRGKCRDDQWSYTVKRDLRPVLPVVNVPIHSGNDFTSTFS